MEGEVPGREVPRRRSAEIKSGGLCSICGESAAEEGKKPSNFCQSCGAPLKKRTELLASQGGMVKIEKQNSMSQSPGLEVEPDPAGSHDFGALEAALGGKSGVEGEIEKDWDPEIARVIDVRGKQPQGLVKKKQK